MGMNMAIELGTDFLRRFAADSAQRARLCHTIMRGAESSTFPLVPAKVSVEWTFKFGFAC